MSVDPPTTNLVLSALGVPPYSARGLEQSLELIDAARSGVRRTINGDLRDLTQPQFRKYRSVITGDDQQPPPIDGYWPGQTVIVDCVCELAYLTDSGQPGRTVVPNSSREDGEWTIYRPRLAMKIVGFSETQDEYGARIRWQMELEEI